MFVESLQHRIGIAMAMNKFLIAAVTVFAVSATSSQAADLAARPYTKAPAPMAVAMYDWSGFYLGINGGGGSSRQCWDIKNIFGFVCAPAFREGCNGSTGGTVGGQIGYRWQAAAWVFGLEAQG